MSTPVARRVVLPRRRRRRSGASKRPLGHARHQERLPLVCRCLPIAETDLDLADILVCEPSDGSLCVAKQLATPFGVGGSVYTWDLLAEGLVEIFRKLLLLVPYAKSTISSASSLRLSPHHRGRHSSNSSLLGLTLSENKAPQPSSEMPVLGRHHFSPSTHDATVRLDTLSFWLASLAKACEGFASTKGSPTSPCSRGSSGGSSVMLCPQMRARACVRVALTAIPSRMHRISFASPSRPLPPRNPLASSSLCPPRPWSHNTARPPFARMWVEILGPGAPSMRLRSLSPSRSRPRGALINTLQATGILGSLLDRCLVPGCEVLIPALALDAASGRPECSNLLACAFAPSPQPPPSPRTTPTSRGAARARTSCGRPNSGSGAGAPQPPRYEDGRTSATSQSPRSRISRRARRIVRLRNDLRQHGHVLGVRLPPAHRAPGPRRRLRGPGRP